MTSRTTILGAFLASTLCAGAAQAATLNWDQGQGQDPGGTLVFDGTRIIGSRIGFDLMNATGTSADGVYHCSGSDGSVASPVGGSRCYLSFESGALQQLVGSTYIFNPGGSISMSGFLSTATPGNTGTVIGGSPLVVSGSVQAYAVTRVGTSGTAAGLGIDIKDLNLADFLGLGQNFVFTMSQLAISSCTGNANAFSCNVNNADFQNTSVPEPGTLALLGLGLVGLGGMRRRKAS